MQPAGQDPGVTIGARNGHTTAPFADECQSFLDNVIAGAPGDRQGVRVKVPNDERVANDIGPESCAAAREGRREALTGVRSGWPLSRESKLQSADAVSKAEGHMDGGVSASLGSMRGARDETRVPTATAARVHEGSSGARRYGHSRRRRSRLQRW
jgi:hypothetical protein